MTKSIKVASEGIISWARIFEENFDDNMEYHQNTQGQYNMNFYPDDVEAFVAEGYPAAKLKKADDGRTYAKLKRSVYNPHLDKKMGPPEVFDFTDGPSRTAWDFNTDGALGNDTRVRVVVDVYHGRAIIDTLEKVGVIKHVSFEVGADGSAVDDVFWAA